MADWSPDGKSLHYLQGDKVYTAEVRTGGSKMDFSAPRELTSVPPDINLISIMPDGKRILATRPVGQRSASHMDLILNWQHLLK